MTVQHYTITIDSNPHEIEVEQVSATQFAVEVDGKRVDVELTSDREASGTAVAPHDAPATEPHTAGAPEAPKALRAAGSRPAGSPSPTVGGGTGTANSMTSPMPGVIAEVRTKQGAQVSKGDTLLVLEAMKMKNELHASQAGVVQEVLVGVGDQVKYGQTLLRYGEA